MRASVLAFIISCRVLPAPWSAHAAPRIMAADRPDPDRRRTPEPDTPGPIGRTSVWSGRTRLASSLRVRNRRSSFRVTDLCWYDTRNKNTTWPNHPHKHSRMAIRRAESLGWRVTTSRGHLWGVLWCCEQSRDGCRIRMFFTPGNPEKHARYIRRHRDGCPRG